MLSQLRDEYWLAGAVAATFTFANAIIAPQISRLVDRWGQSRLLIPTTAVAVVAFVLMMTAANPKWPRWTLFAGALLAAVMPSISAMVRARWTEVFRDRPGLNTAFAFESAADELVYIIEGHVVRWAERGAVSGSGSACLHASALHSERPLSSCNGTPSPHGAAGTARRLQRFSCAPCG